uniref:Uncharacterized protein n=1 Tax=Arundo donax TaxID=35708 RepID=A0A0A9CVV7_ARUDO
MVCFGACRKRILPVQGGKRAGLSVAGILRCIQIPWGRPVSRP